MAITDALQKVLALVEERFVSGKLDGLGVFLTEDRQTILKIHAVEIEDKFSFVRGDVIENGHLFVADDYKALFFERMEPTDEDVRSPFIGKTEGGNGDVGKTGRKISPPTSCHLHGRVTEETQDDCHVVGSKAPEDVFLGPNLTEVKTIGVNVIYFAQFAS